MGVRLGYYKCTTLQIYGTQFRGSFGICFGIFWAICQHNFMCVAISRNNTKTTYLYDRQLDKHITKVGHNKKIKYFQNTNAEEWHNI